MSARADRFAVVIAVLPIIGFLIVALAGTPAQAYELSSPIAAILPVYKRDPILLEVHQLSRSYKAGPTITDTGGLVGYIWAGKHYYVENSLAINPCRLSSRNKYHSCSPLGHRLLGSRLGL